MDTILAAARCVLFACIAAHVAAVNVNRTVDDQKGDSVTGVVPLFLPTDLWNIGQTCTSCVIRAGSPIDPGQVFDGTWRDATHYGDGNPDRIVQVSFTGHAIYVYHTIINILVPGAWTSTNLTFLVDSEYAGNYLHNPTSNDSTPAVFYQMLVYSNTALEQGEHTLQVVTSGDSAALILFDYVIYTTTEDDSQPLPSPSTATASREPTFSASEHSSQLSASSLRSSDVARAPSTTPIQPSIASTSLPSVSPTLPPASAHTVTGPVVGGAVAGIVIVIVVAHLLWVFCLRRTRYRPIGWARTASQPRTNLVKSEDMRIHGHAAVPSSIPFTGRVGYPGSTATPGRKVPPHSVPVRVHESYVISSADSLSEQMNMTHAERLALLTQQVRTFQAELDNLRYARTEMEKSESGSSLPSTAEESIIAMLKAVRDEMSALREVIGEQHSTYGSHGRPPSY